jgi:hypothetical protein
MQQKRYSLCPIGMVACLTLKDWVVDVRISFSLLVESMRSELTWSEVQWVHNKGGWSLY